MRVTEADIAGLHARGDEPAFFEGWYFKHAARGRVLALIPGIHAANGQWSAFLQVIASWLPEPLWLPYARADFACDSPFALRLGANRFDYGGMKLDVAHGGHAIRGELRYGPRAKLAVSALSPGIMGPLDYLRGLECNHGVLSMGHALSGSLEVDGERVDFDGGCGYIEKDWGRSFPSCWLWMQCNSFARRPGLSFVASAARVPLLGMAPLGAFAALRVDGREIRMASYNGARVLALSRHDDQITFALSRGELSLTARARAAHTAELRAPVLGQMSRAIRECAGGTLRVTLTQNARVLLEAQGDCAGVEMVGALPKVARRGV